MNEVQGVDKQQSRFAELAMELMGAQAAQEFIAKAWEVASPEVKQSLADALVARVTGLVKDDNAFALRGVVDKHVTAWANEVLVATAKPEGFAEAVAKSLGERWKSAIDERVKYAVNSLSDAVAEKIRGEWWRR